MKKQILVILLMIFSLQIFAQKQQFMTWKTIELGNKTKKQLLAELKSAGITMYNEDLIDSIKIGSKRKIKLALVTLEELGFNDNVGAFIDYTKVCEAAKKKGLVKCPTEVILQLPLQVNPKLAANTSEECIIATNLIKSRLVYNYGFICYVYFSNNKKTIGGNIIQDGISEGGDQSDNLASGKFVFMIP